MAVVMGHPGVQRTYRLLSEKYWWPDMAREVQHIVFSCSPCAQAKVPRTQLASELKPLPIPAHPWSHLSIDFIVDLPESQGNTTILVKIDRFSKSLRLIPLPAILSPFVTAVLLFRYLFKYFGIPKEIVSDQGLQFISQVWASFMEKMGITSGYHPQANGQVEWAIQEIGRFLWTFCAKNLGDWC